MKLKKKYDFVFIGSSPLSILQSIYYSKIGKDVLIVEKNKYIGGAWTTLNLFGFSGVENAIHYFLPSLKAREFIENFLKLKILNSQKKIRILKKPFLVKINFHYDSIFGKIITKFQSNNFFDLFSKNFLFTLFHKSYYLKNGSKDLINILKKLLKKQNIKILFNHEIKKIYINSKNNSVKLSLSGKIKKIITNKINITHGAKIDNIYGDRGNIKIKHLNELRPCLHLHIKDKQKLIIDELIFNDDKIIKYVHDITNYCNKKIKNQKVLVLALHENIKNIKSVINNIEQKLKDNNMIAQKSKILEYKWTDIYLPQLSDNHLKNLSKRYPKNIKYMLTDNFTLGIQIYHDNWKFIKNLIQ